MNQHQNIPVLPPTQTQNAIVHKEEQKEDPSDGELEDVHDLLTIVIGKGSTHSFSPITTDTDGTNNHSNIITPMRILCNTTKDSSSPPLFITSSAFTDIFRGDFFSPNNHTPTEMMESKGGDKEMAETKDFERLETCTTEESHENAGGSKPGKDGQDKQDYKKQRSAECYSMSRRGEKEKVEWSKTNKRIICFYQRGANFMSSANPTES
jgi:hypothetical protein